jgi:nitrogen fixation protein NifQ
MQHRLGHPVEETLSRMLASWFSGSGSMPQWLGLDKAGFSALMARHFPGFDWSDLLPVVAPLDRERLPEWDDLHRLLSLHRSGDGCNWMADLVTAACLGNDHLWQDLGLWNRGDLSALMQYHFKPLAQRNDKDMKWKKFLYKQLCETEGIYTCRAPSCAVCADYALCFGPEE